MPDGSFKKLSVPPRLNDVLLEPLSVEDHAKYLWFHNRYRSILETIQRKGSKPAAVRQFGESADWLRVVDHLMRRWNRGWAYAYIHHTYPAHDWPGHPERGTVDPLTFAFLWLHGFSSPDVLACLKVQPVSSFSCPVCGRVVGKREIVLRFGLPTCGCAKRILRPIRACVMVSDDFVLPALVESFRSRSLEQRILDLQEVSAMQAGGPLFAFLGRRAGIHEDRLAEAVRSSVPTFTIEGGVGSHGVADGAGNGPVVGGLRL